MHHHYEKFLPKKTRQKQNNEFIPIPYFKDFLIIQPYKNRNFLYGESATYEARRNFFRNGTTISNDTNYMFHSNAFLNRTNPYSNQTTDTNNHVLYSRYHKDHAFNLDIDFDHLNLIDKCKFFFC